VTRKQLLLVGVLLLGLTHGGTTVSSAQDEVPRGRNVILVHGASADDSGWKGVYGILVKDGCCVTLVQEPETSFRKASHAR
jgi:hypothetical protein